MISVEYVDIWEVYHIINTVPYTYCALNPILGRGEDRQNLLSASCSQGFCSPISALEHDMHLVLSFYSSKKLYLWQQGHGLTLSDVLSQFGPLQASLTVLSHQQRLRPDHYCLGKS